MLIRQDKAMADLSEVRRDAEALLFTNPRNSLLDNPYIGNETDNSIRISPPPLPVL